MSGDRWGPMDESSIWKWSVCKQKRVREHQPFWLKCQTLTQSVRRHWSIFSKSLDDWFNWTAGKGSIPYGDFFFCPFPDWYFYIISWPLEQRFLTCLFLNPPFPGFRKRHHPNSYPCTHIKTDYLKTFVCKENIHKKIISYTQIQRLEVINTFMNYNLEFYRGSTLVDVSLGL